MTRRADVSATINVSPIELIADISSLAGAICCLKKLFKPTIFDVIELVACCSTVSLSSKKV